MPLLSRRCRPFAAVLAFVLGLPTLLLRAQVHNGVELVRADLLADTTVVAPGKPFTVGLRLRMAKGWHTYWQYAGDAGLPTKIAWTLPEGFTAGPFRWPIPEKLESAGDILNYGYENEVVLLAEITPPAQLSASEVTLKGKADWLVCADICIPGGKDVTLRLPVGGQPAVANAETFAMYRALLPRTDGSLSVQRELKGKDLRLTFQVPTDAAGGRSGLEFFPLPPDDVEVGHPETEGAEAKGTTGTTAAATFRVPIVTDPAGAENVGGLLVVTSADGDRTGYAVPTIAGGEERPRSSLDAAKPQPAPADHDGVQGSSGSGTIKDARPYPAAVTSTLANPGTAGSLWRFLLLGLLGGLILNVMPCVLPVISLKVFSFVRQANEDPARVWRLGLAYVGGIFAWFLGFAALVVGLKAAGREVGYAFHFQNPIFLLGLSAVVFVFALSLLGVFEIVLPGANLAAGTAAPKEGLAGAFFQGVLATVLASACTAPVFGTALGFAFGQPAPVIFGMFAAVALGMGLPFLLLAARPGWLRFLPKPGVWMERIKQLTGFALLATTLWLLYVLGTLRGAEAVIAAGGLLLALGFGAWLLGNFATPVASGRSRGIAWAAVVVITLATGIYTTDAVRHAVRPGAGTLAAANGGAAVGGTFSDQLQAAWRENRPVFVDFTAEWCVNCKVNEKTVLATEPVQRALRERNVRFLKADWTDGAEDITRLLRGFGKAGVPLYVIYPAGKPDAPVVLPELLTQGIVLDALAEAERRAAPAPAAAAKPVALR